MNRRKPSSRLANSTAAPLKRSMKVSWGKPAEFSVPIPKNEKARVATLRRYQILDTPAEKLFDNITSLAALVCETPIALISLVDSDRQWFKSKYGAVDASETARSISFCAHAIMKPDVFVIRDATKDPRFVNSPLVTSDPKIRFYAGAPIVTPENHVIGTLCVVDHVARELTPSQSKALQALSHQVMLQLEMRRQMMELQRQAQPPRPRA
jgi:GAF domain-containing protein